MVDSSVMVSNEELFAKAYMMLAQHEEYFNVKLSPEESKAYVMARIRELLRQW